MTATLDVIAKWRRLLALGPFTITLFEEPPPEPARHAAFSETEFSSKSARVWAKTEDEVIHELVHVLLSGLDDVFMRTTPSRALRALWTRREEGITARLERVLVKLNGRRASS